MEHMNFAQYCRIESMAGGLSCSDREFIRAALTKLSAEGKSVGKRAWRHAWLRDGLAQKNKQVRMLRGMGL